jgi:hypothetical protein
MAQLDAITGGKPEVAIGIAFLGGFVAAQILKRLAR